MKHLVTYFTVAFTAFGCAFPAGAQVVQNRDSADYYFQRGKEFEGWLDMSDADVRKQTLANYTKSIAFDSTHYRAYLERGECYRLLKDYSSALADYDRAVVLESRSGTEGDASLRFKCLDLCLRLARWREAEAHCSVLLANPHACRDTASAGPWLDWDATGLNCRTIWLDRAEARAKLGQLATARQDYLVYQRQTLAELAVEERFLVENQAPPALYWRRTIPTSKKERAKTPTSLTKLSPRQPLPSHLRAEVLARHQKMLARQWARVTKLRTESEAAAAKVAELDKLLH